MALVINHRIEVNSYIVIKNKNSHNRTKIHNKIKANAPIVMD